MHHRLLLYICTRLELDPLPFFLWDLGVINQDKCRQSLDYSCSVVRFPSKWVILERNFHQVGKLTQLIDFPDLSNSISSHEQTLQPFQLIKIVQIPNDVVF